MASSLYGLDLQLKGNLRVNRTQTEPMVFGSETDGINSFYVYKGVSAEGPFTYQGAAIHATALVGGDGTHPVGTVTGIASQAASTKAAADRAWYRALARWVARRFDISLPLPSRHPAKKHMIGVLTAARASESLARRILAEPVSHEFP